MSRLEFKPAPGPADPAKIIDFFAIEDGDIGVARLQSFDDARRNKTGIADDEDFHVATENPPAAPA